MAGLATAVVLVVHLLKSCPIVPVEFKSAAVQGPTTPFMEPPPVPVVEQDET